MKKINFWEYKDELKFLEKKKYISKNKKNTTNWRNFFW